MSIPLHVHILWFLKTQLGIMACLGLILMAYAGFYWLTAHRLDDPGLRTRMYVFCRLIEETTKKDFDEKAVEKVLQETIDKQKTDLLVPMSVQQIEIPVSHTEGKCDACRYRSIGLLRQAAGDERLTEEEIKQWITEKLKILRNHPAPSHEYIEAITQLQIGLLAIREKDQFSSHHANDRSFLKWRSRFFIDEYKRTGVDLKIPSGDLSSLSDDAKFFLTHRDMFRDKAKHAPVLLKFRPWQILKAYDERRMNLSDTIPLALGILALAAGTFLQIRLHDVDKRDGDLVFRSRDGNWINLWAHDGVPEPLALRLFTKWIFWLVAGVFTGLALFVELFLNNPQTRLEWLPNVPIMLATGLLLAVLWITLFDMARASLNPELARRTPAFRSKLLRPLHTGIAALLLVTAWGVLYSIFQLAPLSEVQQGRAWLQIFLCGATAILLLWVMWNLDRNLKNITLAAKQRNPPIDWEVSAREEEALNSLPRSEILSQWMPAIDVKLIKSAMMVLIPLPSVLQALFS